MLKFSDHTPGPFFLEKYFDDSLCLWKSLIVRYVKQISFFLYVFPLLYITEPLNFLDAYNILQKSHPEFTEADMRTEMLTFYFAVSNELLLYTGTGWNGL